MTLFLYTLRTVLLLLCLTAQVWSRSALEWAPAPKKRFGFVRFLPIFKALRIFYFSFGSSHSINALNFSQFVGRAVYVLLGLTINGNDMKYLMGWRRIWLCAIPGLGSSLLLKHGTDLGRPSVSGQAPSILSGRTLVLTSLRACLCCSSMPPQGCWAPSRCRSSSLPCPLDAALRLSHRQVLEAQPKHLSNRESSEFKSKCCS